MNNFEEYLIALKTATRDQNFQTQIQIILQLIKCIEQSNNKASVIQDILRINLGEALNDVISSQFIVLLPTLKLICYFMKDLHFQSYQFLNIFKNILRVLILYIESDKIEKCQLEFFQVVNFLDVLLKKYLLKNPSRKEANEELQTIFVCLLKFVELVNFEKCFASPVKNLTMEIYLHLLTLIKMHKCIFKNFHLIIKVSNLADVFLDFLYEKYQKEADELWLFKLTEILFRLLESCNNLDALQIKCFENIFYKRMSFVLEQIMIQNCPDSHIELFKFYISMLNIILWTPTFSKNFCNKIIKTFIKIKADSMIFVLSKSSRKIRQYTQYSMKIFLSSFIIHSDGSPPISNHLILDTFLQAHFSKTLIDLKFKEIVKNSKLLILLYGCSFFKHQLRSPLNANKVLANIAIILEGPECNLDDHEIWNILRIYSYYSNYAVLSSLEHIGVQNISEHLLKKSTEFLLGKQSMHYQIDKYILSFAKDLSPKMKIINTMVLAYMSQEPSPKDSNIGFIFPANEVLPFIVSNDSKQVANAVAILQQKHLNEDDLDFIIKHCFSNLKSDEINIEGALTLIKKNFKTVSTASAKQIFLVSIKFLEAKKVTPKYSTSCYYLMMTTCVSLASNIDPHFEQFDVPMELSTSKTLFLK